MLLRECQVLHQQVFKDFRSTPGKAVIHLLALQNKKDVQYLQVSMQSSKVLSHVEYGLL